MTVRISEDGGICPRCGYLNEDVISYDPFRLEQDITTTYCDSCFKQYYLTTAVTVKYISSSEIDEEGEMQ